MHPLSITLRVMCRLIGLVLLWSLAWLNEEDRKMVLCSVEWFLISKRRSLLLCVCVCVCVCLCEFEKVSLSVAGKTIFSNQRPGLDQGYLARVGSGLFGQGS